MSFIEIPTEVTYLCSSSVLSSVGPTISKQWRRTAAMTRNWWDSLCGKEKEDWRFKECFDKESGTLLHSWEPSYGISDPQNTRSHAIHNRHQDIPGTISKVTLSEQSSHMNSYSYCQKWLKPEIVDLAAPLWHVSQRE